MTTKRTAAIDDLAAWVAAYKAAVGNAKGWQEVADRAKQHITTALDKADAEIGTVNGEPAVRWTVVESSRLNTKKLRAEHPQLVDQFTAPSSSRRFTLVETGDNQ